jgi:hypothetical protein
VPVIPTSWGWEVGADSSVLYQPHYGRQPPKLMLTAGVEWVTLAPPLDRAEYPQFTRFLRELREAAAIMAMDCHPISPWGRHVFGAS